MKILFLIHDLGQGGAEKVLVNLVNNMDRSKFDISVTALFGGGINEQFLAKDIHYRSVFPKAFPGNSKVMKLLTPKQLHRLCVKEEYDIEVSYLEGPSARVISGCTNPRTRLISWIHSIHHSMKMLATPFRNEKEATNCYATFHNTVCVSESVKDDFCNILNFTNPCEVLHNTVESDKIILQSKDMAAGLINNEEFKIAAVGTLKKVKGFDRLLRVVKLLNEQQYPIHLYVLGQGPQKEELKNYIEENKLSSCVTLLGYQKNPYQYVSKCDLFVCSSYAEGFSTAVTEALIVGTPVCTVDVSGMKELLGNNNEYGLITKNDEKSLYDGIKKLLDNCELLKYYKEQAVTRGEMFEVDKTVKDVERMLVKMISED